MPYVKTPSRSVDLVAGERLRNLEYEHTAQGANWSVAVWCKPVQTITTNRFLFSVEPFSASPYRNAIQIFFSVGGAFNNLNVLLYSSSGVLLKNYVWLAWWTYNTWVHTTLTWDGTNLRGYRNGIENPSPIKWTDNAGTMADPPARRIGVGTLASTGLDADAFPGRIHSAALWNVALNANAVREIYNGGYGEKVDLLTNRGNYTSAPNLQHYWRTGHFYPPDSGIGRDYGVATTNRRNVMNNAVNIDGSDIVYDYPGK